MNSFYDAVSGVRTGKTVAFRNDRGEPVELAVHEIVAPLEAVDSPGAREAAFMREIADGMPFKVTFPAASIFAHPFTTVEGAYESVDAFVRRSDRDRAGARGRRDRGRGALRPVRLPPVPLPGRSGMDRSVRGGGP